jgi:hypothetical protein
MVVPDAGDVHKPFRVVQPWERHKARQSTVVSEHETADDAFNEINRLSTELAGTGAPSNAVELLVIDEDGRVVTRPNAN